MPTTPITNWYPYFDSSGNFTESYGWDNILKEIFIVLVTRPGTRQWQPEFGCKLLDMLFEINLTENDFVNVIQTAFDKWLPHINLVECKCNISNLNNRNGLKADIDMTINYEGETKDVVFNIPPEMDLQNGVIHNIKVYRKE